MAETAEARDAALVGDVLDVEKTALLIHGLAASPDVRVSAAVVGERIAAVANISMKSAAAVAEALVGTVGDGSGEADPSVLACSMALLADASPNERLKLAFQACDGTDSGFVTVHRLSHFIKAFSGVLVAAVECILAATGVAMGATNSNAHMMLLRDTMPKMKATIASLSRSAKELWSPHGIGVADFQIWASSNHSVSVWVKRLAGVWAGPIVRLGVSTARIPADGLAALKQAEPLLSAAKLTELLSAVWPGNAASLRDRMFVMHNPEDGIHLQKKDVAISLLLLFENLEARATLETIAEMQHQASEGAVTMEGVTIDSVVQTMGTLSREVADGLLVCCSLLVDGRPRGGVSRQQAFELLDPPLKEVCDRIAGTVVTEAIDTSSGEITPELFSKAVSANADMVAWVENLQTHWPSLAMLYSSTFCRALRVRHATRRGQHSAGGEDGSPQDTSAAASKIQALLRGSIYRNKMKNACKGAVTLQSFWRMMQAKKDVEAIKARQAEEDVWERERRQRIERLHRNEAEMLAMKQVPANAVETWSMSRRVDAIIAIQAVARGRAVRRSMPLLRLELQHANAARVIQKCVRRWITAPKETAALPAALPRNAKVRPRPITKMSQETVAVWQNVIYNRRKRRPRPEPSELWAMRREIQEKLNDRSLRRMEFEDRNATRNRLLRSIPAQTQLLMEAADLSALREDEDEWLDRFPAPPASRLQQSRESHVAYRRGASEQPKASLKEGETAHGVRDDALVDMLGELSGHQSSPTSQEMLRPVMTSDREALEAELEALRRQLGSTALRIA